MRHWFPDDLADPFERLPHHVAGRTLRAHLTDAVPYGIRPHRRHRWTTRFAKASRHMQPGSPFRHHGTSLLFPHRQITHPVLPHAQESVVENHVSIEAPPKLAPLDEPGYRDADSLITMRIGCHRMQQLGTDNSDASLSGRHRRQTRSRVGSASPVSRSSAHATGRGRTKSSPNSADRGNASPYLSADETQIPRWPELTATGSRYVHTVV